MTTISTKQWVLILAFLAMLSATIATNSYLRIPETDVHHDWLKLFIFNLINWYLWIFALPFMLYAIQRYPLFSGKFIRHWLVHILVAMVILLVLSNLRVIIGAYYWDYFDPFNAPEGRYQAALVNRLMNEWLVYVLLVSILSSYATYMAKRAEKRKTMELRSRQKELENQLKAAQALQQLERERQFIAKLPVKENDKTLLLDIQEIYSVEAFDNYVKVHTLDKVHLLKRTLKSLEDQLSPYLFIRVHRSFLVNLQHISSIEPLFHGEYNLYLKNGLEVKLTRSYRESLDKILGTKVD